MTDAPPKPGPVAHRCCSPGCDQWSSFGYQPDPLLPEKDRVWRWYCREHWPDAPERKAAAPAAPDPEPKKSTPPAKPGQGRLL